MRVAVVGNGPSAAGRGAEIDVHDFVIRCTAFPICGADGAGVKLSAWARFGSPWVASKLSDRIPEGDYEVWMAKPLAFWGRSDKVDPELVIRQANGRPVRWVTDDLVTREAKALGAEPTTGFTAIDMAVAYLRPAELTLYGFDATVPEAPGWGDARLYGVGWNPLYPHDLVAEKRLLAAFRDSGEWLGGRPQTRLIWGGPGK